MPYTLTLTEDEAVALTDLLSQTIIDGPLTQVYQTIADLTDDLPTLYTLILNENQGTIDFAPRSKFFDTKGRRI